MAAEKRKDSGEWRVRWRKLDGTRCSRKCPNRKTALTLDLEIKEAHARGRDWEPPTVGGEPAVSDVVTAYLEYQRIRVRKNTLKGKGCHMDLFERFLKERDKYHAATMGDMSRPLMEEFLAWLMRPETGRHKHARALGSAGKTVAEVQRLWEWAGDADRWQGIPRARKVDVPKPSPALVVAPTWEEMDRCVAACNGWQKNLATWLRWTGLRAGESMLFEWRDVDLKAGRLTIRAEVSKTGIGRIIPLAPAILDEIATWGVREGYLIPTKRHRDAKFHREPRARDILRAWKRAGVREEVWKRRPEHAFRRGFKSGLLALGANPDAVDYLQGHSLGEGSRGRYIDPVSLPLAETVKKVPTCAPASRVVFRLPSVAK